MYRSVRLALIAATTALATACSGGGGSDGGGSSDTPTPVSPMVQGPIDPVQEAIATSVFDPLNAAAAGTPLLPVLLCTQSIVNGNLLDIADAFANGLGSAGSGTDPAAAAQGAVQALISNLSGLLTALAGNAGCTGAAPGTSPVPGSNPLAGTPLEALGAALLPVLADVRNQLPAAGGAPLSVADLSVIAAQLASAFASGLSQIPIDTADVPMIGGVLESLQASLAQFAVLAQSYASGASPAQVAAAMAELARTTITGLLTQAVPVELLQARGTGGGNPLAELRSAIETLTASLRTSPGLPLPTHPFDGAGFGSLEDLIALLSAELPEALAGLPAGTSPLETARGPLANLLHSLLAPILGGGGGCLLAFLGLC